MNIESRNPSFRFRSDTMNSSKGVSPLIASVLLIAFTMAIAAILTAWISSFTTAQKEKTAVFEQKIDCNYGFLEIDPDSSQWNQSQRIFKARIRNTGTIDLSIGKYQVYYAGGVASTSWKVETPTDTNTSIAKNEEKVVYVNVTDSSGEQAHVNKVKFIANFCDGVSTSAIEPLGGWSQASLSTAVVAATVQ